MRYTKIMFVVLFLLLFGSISAHAAEVLSTYLTGKLYAGDEAYTANGSVQLICYTGDSVIYTGSGTDAEGNFTFDSSDDYGPCGSVNGGLEYSSCDLYAYPNWADETFTMSEIISVEINCGGSLNQDLHLTGRDKTIEITIMADDEIVTENMEVFCNQKEEPYSSFLTTSPTGDVYVVSAVEGNYSCIAQCTSGCNFGGDGMTEVYLGPDDESVSATINFTLNDKTLRVTLMAGGSPITSGMSVSANEEGGNGSYLMTEEAVDGAYELSVGVASYYVSAYCSYGSECTASGYSYATVTVEEDDTVIDLMLTFIENDSTISGIITDGTGGIAGAYVDVYSYSIGYEGGTDGAGNAAGSTNSLLDKAITEVWESDLSTVYNYTNTDENGAFELMMPAGTYVLSVMPPYERSDVGQKSMTVTTTEGETLVVNLELPTKTAVISGSVKDAYENGLANAYVSGWSNNGENGTNDNFYAITDENGEYSVYAIEGLTYNVTSYFWVSDPASTICTYDNEGMQSITASSEEQILNFTYPTCDCTLVLNTVDSEENVIPSVYGGLDATPTSFDEEEMWYGAYGYIEGGVGNVKVQSGVEYNITPYINDDEYVPDDSITGTCSGGITSIDYELLPLDATISGNFVDSEGNALSVNSYNRIYISASKGGDIYRSCDTSTGGFSCQVSAGEWCVGYWVDPITGYASSAGDFAAGCLTMESGGSETLDITLYKTGSVVVTTIDHLGDPKPNVFVEATPYSNADNGETDSEFMPNGCMTNSEGTCTIDIAATADGVTYYLNAYIPYSLRNSENIMLPEEISVTVIENEETVAETLAFREPDGTSVITLTEGSAEAALSLGKFISKVNEDDQIASPLVNATIDCFSPAGGSFEVETDENGSATCPCTTADLWYAIAYNMVSNNLWMSQVAEITCLEDGGVGEVTINNIAVVPEGKSMTVSDAGSQQLRISLSDGFSVLFPAGTLGDDGETATCNVDVTVTPITANKIPASFYGYEVSCMDGNGAPIIQLNNNATFSVPINLGQVENLDLSLETIEMTYFNTSTGAYDIINGYTIDTTNNVITYQQNHLTSFIIVGNGNLNTITGEEGGDEIGARGREEGNGGDEVIDGLAASGGCGCSVAFNTPLPEKLLTGIILILSLIGLWIARACTKKAK